MGSKYASNRIYTKFASQRTEQTTLQMYGETRVTTLVAVLQKSRLNIFRA